MGDLSARLERARNYLAIAESGDAKREAYRMAAEEVAAEQEATGASIPAIAAMLQQAPKRVEYLLRWRSGGYVGETPWRYAGKDETAANAHAKRVLRERPEVVAAELAKQPAERRAAFAAGLMADPEVAGVVMDQPAVRVAIHAADKDRQVKQAHNREHAEATMAPVVSAAATLGSIGLLDEARRLRRSVAFAVENDASLPEDAVAEVRGLLMAMDHDLVVYAARHGYPAGRAALGTSA
jgi:hypothetical protein